MKYDLKKILSKLESNVIPRSLGGVDLEKHRRKLMANMKYEVISSAAPKVVRPDFVERAMAGAAARYNP